MCGNYFAQPVMKVMVRGSHFKTNNSSEVLYTLHISNAPTMVGERYDERFGGKLHSNSCHLRSIYTERDRERDRSLAAFAKEWSK